MMTNLGFITHLLLDHLGTLTQRGLELGNGGCLEFPSWYTICKHDIKFTVSLEVSLLNFTEQDTHSSKRFWESEVTVCPRNGIGSQKEETAFRSPVPERCQRGF